MVGRHSRLVFLHAESAAANYARFKAAALRGTPADVLSHGEHPGTETRHAAFSVAPELQKGCGCAQGIPRLVARGHASRIRVPPCIMVRRRGLRCPARTEYRVVRR